MSSEDQRGAVPEFVSVGDFAVAVGATEDTVRRWIKGGTIGAVRVGGRVIVPRSELDRLHAEARANVAREPQPPAVAWNMAAGGNARHG